VNILNDKIRQGCDKLGYHGFVTRHNRENCTTSGFCLLGCPFDAKQSMLITYIPAASKAGARIQANCPVRRIHASGDRVQSVEATVVDVLGRPRHRLDVDAEVVVLSAGAINSPQILLNSGIANSSDQVGRNLHLHPSVLLAGIYDDNIYGYRGIPQSYYVDEFIDLEKNPDSGYVLMPVFGFPVATAAQLPGFGREHWEIMRNYHRTAGILVLMHDQSAGAVRVDRNGKPEITYQVNARERQLFLEGMKHCAEILFAGGARKVLVPYASPLWLKPGDDLGAIDRRGLRPHDILLAATHPQSTCKMGEDPSRSVVNSWCQSHDLKTLFIADMSVFPSSLGAPPQISTAAIADRTAHYVRDNWKKLVG
jgi:choline dehydrogenase-like flavoprotein